jgi:uncharacterized protein YndB with AHSA1/START domain
VPETPSGTRTVEHEIRIEARPETVFAYFTDPAKMVRWMGTEATVDPRPGGVYRLRMSRDIGEGVISGEFAEVTPHSRIVFTWGYEGDLFGVPPASTRVEVSLTPDGTGTLLRIVHRTVPAGAAPVHDAGWRHYAERLKLAAEGGDPGPDAWLAPGIASASAPEETT